MKLGQFGETYPPTLDGVGQVMYAYCRELGKLGHECYYVAPQNPRAPVEVDCNTMLYASVPVPKHSYQFGFPMVQPRFRRALYEEQFDLVHAHTPFMAGYAARHVARRQKIPLIATFHSKYYDDAVRVTHSKTLSKRILKTIVAFYESCDEVWTVNGSTAEVLRGYGYRGDIIIMPNGIDPHESATGDKTALLDGLPLSDGEPVLLFVGQQDYKKNTRALIEACSLLDKSNFPFKLIMVGEGQDRVHLTALAQSLGLSDKVCFTGPIFDRERLMAIYQRADLLVFPSIYDNAPLVVREAALEGTPALVVAGSCAAEGIRDGENGYTCVDSPRSIADGIVRALPTCSLTGERARLTIPVSWEAIAKRVVERYLQACEKKARADGIEAESMT